MFEEVVEFATELNAGDDASRSVASAQSFDYIIVGGGTTGLGVAAR